MEKKQTKGKKLTLAEQYIIQEQKSLARKATKKESLGYSSKEIRQVIHELLKTTDKVYLAPLAHVLCERNNYDTLKAGQRIMSAVDMKQSGLIRTKDENNRRYITKK